MLHNFPKYACFSIFSLASNQTIPDALHKNITACVRPRHVEYLIQTAELETPALLHIAAQNIVERFMPCRKAIWRSSPLHTNQTNRQQPNMMELTKMWMPDIVYQPQMLEPGPLNVRQKMRHGEHFGADIVTPNSGNSEDGEYATNVRTSACLLPASVSKHGHHPDKLQPQTDCLFTAGVLQTETVNATVNQVKQPHVNDTGPVVMGMKSAGERKGQTVYTKTDKNLYDYCESLKHVASTLMQEIWTHWHFSATVLLSFIVFVKIFVGKLHNVYLIS